MSIYSKIYNNLCEDRSQLKSHYMSGSGLHAHHILPRHMGGIDSEENLTYLTVREHIIAHFLLWKMNRNPNDLRAMKMLGANLTIDQRRVIGEYCRDNELGFFDKKYDDVRSDWRQLGRDNQDLFDGKSFMFWASEEGRKKRASLGGKASLASGNNREFAYYMSPEGRKKRASLGAAASGKKSVTNGVINRKLKTEEERQLFLSKNPDWRIGITRKRKPGAYT